MKKKILSIAMAVIATMAISANAQKPGACPENQQCANHCTAEKAQCSPQDCKLFEGINLNEKQKAQFKELKEKCAKERKEACAAKKQAKCQRDATMKSERRQNKQNRLKEVKSILTPEQYVVFLENFYVNTPQRQQPGAKKIHKGKEHGKRPMTAKNEACKGSRNCPNK